MHYWAEVVEVVGLTADRWEVALVGLGILCFTAGVLLVERF